MQARLPRRLLVASQPLGEGVPRQVLDTLELLDSERFEIDVACPRESTLWEELSRRGGVSLHAIPPHRRPSPADAGTLARLLPLVARADVVHAHAAKAGLLARLAAALRGRKARCLYTPHAWSFWAATGAARRTYVAFERFAARWCRLIVVVSEDERRAGLAAGIGAPEQYRVVLNGIELERYALPPAPVPGRVVFVARLAAQKRPEVAVRAFARVRKAVPAAELLLVGRGPQRDEIEQLVAEMGLADCVRLLGDRDDVPQLLAQATCLVLTSDYEGCPLTVLEAMAAGVPVVATAVGGVPELVEHERTGLLVGPGDEVGLAVALQRLLTNPGLASALGAEARREAERRFSRERMAASIAALYEEVADGARR